MDEITFENVVYRTYYRVAMSDIFKSGEYVKLQDWVWDAIFEMFTHK